MRRTIGFLCALLFLLPAVAFPQIGGRAGAFLRLGFGARGMGMGNALTAVTTGDAVSYYNPAALAHAQYRAVSLSYGFLSLDRSLNFVGFTQPAKPTAGIFIGLVNSGVSEIDGRDSDGEPTGHLRTSENAAMLGFATRFSSGFSVGFNLKLLYHRLYTDVSSTTVGIDAGILLPVGNSFTVGATVRDINSRYKWDTSKLYGDQQGKTSEDKFPQLYTLGVAYMMADSVALLSAEIERSNQASTIARLGAEVQLLPELTVRAGIDRIDLLEKGNGVRPAFGFTVRKDLDAWTPALSYAFVAEPFTSTPMHILSVSLIF